MGNPRDQAAMGRWFEVANRRSRLRSASRASRSVAEIAATERRPKPHESVDVSSDSEDDDVDPEYRLFLQNLKVDGKSIVLGMKIGDSGESFRVTYEGDSSSEDDSRVLIQSEPDEFPTAKKSKKGNSSSSSGECVFPDTAECEVTPVSSRLRSDSPKPETGSVAEITAARRHSKPQKLADLCSEWEDDADPEYRLFLKNLKVDGKSCVLEMKIGDSGESLRVRYEEEEGDSSFEDDSCVLIPPEPDEIPTSKKSGKGNSSSSSGEVVFPDSVECEVTPEKKSKGNSSSSSGRFVPDSVQSEVGGSEVDEDYKAFMDYLKMSDSARKQKSEVGGSEVDEDYMALMDYLKMSDSAKKQKKGSSSSNSSGLDAPDPNEHDVDEDYQNFLNHLRESDGSMILELDDHVIVKYEEEEEEEEEEDDAGDDSELGNEENEETKEDGEEESTKVPKILVKTEDSEERQLPNSKTLLQPHRCSSQPSNSSVCLMETTAYSIPTHFKDRLTAILQQPFDQNEYDKLMSMAETSTPKKKLKHLRKMSKAYATNEMGLSYFEHYPSLADMINNTVDNLLRLTLLRHFFFWLENLVYDEAFAPWSSSSSSSFTLTPSGCSPMFPLQLDMTDG